MSTLSARLKGPACSACNHDVTTRHRQRIGPAGLQFIYDRIELLLHPSNPPILNITVSNSVPQRGCWIPGIWLHIRPNWPESAIYSYRAALSTYTTGASSAAACTMRPTERRRARGPRKARMADIYAGRPVGWAGKLQRQGQQRPTDGKAAEEEEQSPIDAGFCRSIRSARRGQRHGIRYIDHSAARLV